ncbi:MAG: DNA-3-methyladenine glycosylase 2 family protein [Lachnospiraceae bacterium]|nr:DNA-3-methyladenine glycosylase 2 family protein [Lachnospiraceae bacterium]
MNLQVKNNDLWVDEIKDFKIGQTLECGQSFHFEKNKDEYIIIAHNRILRARQISDDTVVFYDMSKEEFEEKWIRYFDLDRDYGEIKKSLLSKDKKLKEAIEEKSGVRIMNQDFFEMLISFIISQNKQIPHIKKIVFDISKRWGTYLGNVDGKPYYAFPTPRQMAGCTIEDFIKLKTGFRAPYLYDAVNKVLSGEINEKDARALDGENVIKYLCQIKGVGEKVANCVALFSLDKRDAFPVDVWIKRIMEKMYFGKETDKRIISEFAKEHFGEYGGYAQQYLFYYARDEKISVDKK